VTGRVRQDVLTIARRPGADSTGTEDA
jgi:hypothetical protein